MKKAYLSSALAIAFALSGLPVAVAQAERGDADADVQIRVQAESGQSGADATTSVSGRAGQDNESTVDSRGNQDQRGREHRAETASSSDSQEHDATLQENDGENDDLDLEMESTTTVAFSLGELKQMIEVRRHKLDQEEASTSPEHQDIVKDANQVRLAVHVLLASKELLGGIGGDVSQIAQEVGASVGTTTREEAQITSRGFWAKLFFGGDSSAADRIQQEVDRNQANIQKLIDLLNQAGLSADIGATLTAQVAAVQEQQVRLAALAQKERGRWGIFSWRF